jgi:hypothetical protein
MKMIWWELLAICVGVAVIVFVAFVALICRSYYKKRQETLANEQIVYGQLNPAD